MQVGIHTDQKEEDGVPYEGNKVGQEDEVDQEAGILELREEAQENEVCSGCAISFGHISALSVAAIVWLEKNIGHLLNLMFNYEPFILELPLSYSSFFLHLSRPMWLLKHLELSGQGNYGEEGEVAPLERA